ncbi:MAG: hypothetical protein RL272_88, partial [Candidatus Parcubacteria bacterium]
MANRDEASELRLLKKGYLARNKAGKLFISPDDPHQIIQFLGMTGIGQIDGRPVLNVYCVRVGRAEIVPVPDVKDAPTRFRTRTGETFLINYVFIGGPIRAL